VSIAAGDCRPVLAVTGLALEARIAAGPGVETLAGAGNRETLTRAIEDAIARGARGVISFGVAGGLDASLRSGSWLVASGVVSNGMRWTCDSAWTSLLRERLRSAQLVELAGVDDVVGDAAGKRDLRQRSGAAAVDTESHIAAAIAAVHDVPFAAFRVVVDRAGRDLPPAASLALRADGTVRGRSVLRSIARRPTQIPALVATALSARVAFAALSRGRRFLGPGLACPHFRELVLDDR
jgi:adenosylhomocysteine nucleosidase